MKQHQFIRFVHPVLKVLKLFGYALLLNFVFATSVTAITYEVKRVASNLAPWVLYSREPLLDGTTGVVWSGLENFKSDIFRYAVFQRNVSDDERRDVDQDVNRHGSIVWQGFNISEYTRKIYLSDVRDPDNIVNLTPEELELSWHPRINDSGQVVWVSGRAAASFSNIYLYDANRVDGHSVEKISERSQAHSPEINNSGNVVWVRKSDYVSGAGYNDEIIFYDGSTITNISNSPNSDDSSPRIGNGTKVAWIGDDGNDKEIHYWDGSAIHKISDNNVDDSQLEMSSNGYVVWVSNQHEIFLYKDGVTSSISNTLMQKYNPHVNNNGFVVWDNNEGGIYVYDGRKVSRVNRVGAEGSTPRINRINTIAWGGGENVYRAMPVSKPRLGSRAPFPASLVCPDDPTRLCPLVAMQKAPEIEISTGQSRHDDVTCNGCAFSNKQQSSYMPVTLVRARQAIFPLLIEKPDSKRFTDVLTTLIPILKKQPVGLRFNKSMRKATLGEISTYLKKKKNADALKNRLLAVVNAMELDWRVPKLEVQKIKSGANQSAQFGGVAWATLHKVKKPGTLSLEVENGVPALSKSHELGWPFAKYSMKFSGQVEGPVDITFYYGGLGFGGKRPSPRLLQWDGKAYTDVTTVINYESRTITGRVNKLSTFVLMNPIRIDGRYIPVGKQQTKKQGKQKSK